MITGYNTDVEHDGVIYHVQTEDKGIESPVILSLVYSGGAILASKRAPYKDLLASGFDEQVLAERLKRQHRLICAAIHAGRLADLKRMSGADVTPETAPPVNGQEASLVTEVSQASAGEPPIEVLAPVALEEPSSTTEPSYPRDLRRESPLGEAPANDQGLAITLLDNDEFRSGESLLMRILVGRRSGEDLIPLKGVQVSVKVLGTTFRPQIQTVKTESDGVAIVSTEIPQFASGRAAILIRATADGEATEIRRVIVPGQ